MMNLLLLLAPILLLAIVALLGFVGCSFHSGAATTRCGRPAQQSHCDCRRLVGPGVMGSVHGRN